MNTKMNPRVESREAHIIDLARIVGTRQGEPKTDAVTIVIDLNNVKDSAGFNYECLHEYNEGEAQWNALEAGAGWAPVCRYCLPRYMEAGEVILDRRSAHETLAYMLGGRAGRDEYRAYFDYLGDPFELVRDDGSFPIGF